jgi:GT2 family glycosyltransferase
MNNKDKSNILDEPFVAIVILVWNNYEDSRKCIESCCSLTYKNLMVILVDNGSVDGSGQCLFKEFPNVDFIYNTENLGYAGGNNAGIRRALERGAEFVLVLNNDVEIESKDSVGKMVSCFKKMPKIGILGPRIKLMQRSKGLNGIEFKSGLYSYIKKHFLPKVNFYVPNDLGFTVIERVVVSGCAIMMSRELLDKVGYFNEEFFMYGEEDDLCLRALKAGFLVAYVDDRDVSVARNGYTSYDDLVPWKAFLMARNRFLQLRSFSIHAQFVIVFLHIASVGKITIKRVLRRRWKNIIYSFLGLIFGLLIWSEDILGWSKPGKYLISGRRVAQEGLIPVFSKHKL